MDSILKISKYDISVINKILESGYVQGSLLACFLASRGIVSKVDIYNYLNPNIESCWDNPYNIKGMDDVAGALENAIRNSKRILIYGDYDVDGISSVSLMILALREIKKHTSSTFTVDYYIPDRFNEGYGFCECSVDNILNMDNRPEFIITVDCGITAKKEIEILQNNNIDVVVTDHHKVSNNYPDNAYLINPNAENANISHNLAGVGVVLKLIQVLGARFGMPYIWLDYTDIACLGTLADIMPLIDQNRSLVSHGINLINTQPRYSIKALLDVVGKSNDKLNSSDISFFITPRLNSAGRLNNPNLAVKLLISQNYADSYNYALEIENCNIKRKKVTEETYLLALNQADKILENNPNKCCLVLYGENWHDGVRGIVASKIANKYNKPTIIFNSVDDNIVSGSGRSVGCIDLHEACLNCYDKYIKFGGHKNACGLSLLFNNLSTFANNLEIYLNNLNKNLFLKIIKIDLEISFSEINLLNVEELNKIEPVGMQNEEPLFLTCNVFIKNAKIIGKTKNHLLCNLSNGLIELQAIMFFVDNISTYINYNKIVSVIYTPKIEKFMGKKKIKLFLKKIITNNYFEPQSESDFYIKDMYDLYKSNNIKNNYCSSSIVEYNKEFVNKSKKVTHHSSLNNSSNNLSNKVNYKDLDDDTLQQKVVEAMIGKTGKLHDSQIECLRMLKIGKSLLAIMPTGRGKSLIFQVYAAMIALKYDKTSIFVYPLRALISDQAYHLETSLEKFGLCVKVINGETENFERERIYNLLAVGKVDILLTTPEYLSIHKNDFANSSKIGFIVIDECHHLGEIRIGQRSAYGHLPQILDLLNNPQVLALSATVNNEVYLQIKNYIPIDCVVKDNFERKNLYIDDRRNLSDRDNYLVALVCSKQKTLIYVNSHQQTIDLARMIKSRAPHMALKVGFYNAGMTRDMRNKIEKMFRDNNLIVLVATSAFGEGVNIPDVRHVCLYHLPFSDVEFNQMCGRCGRDNNDALIHLLYNSSDASINSEILLASNPDRELLGKIYLWIKNSFNDKDFIVIDKQVLLDLYISHKLQFAPTAFTCALDVFNELGLFNVSTVYKNDTSYIQIHRNNNNQVNLEDSSRFCEGQNEIENFKKYNNFAMKASANQLTQILRHPILPN